MRALVLGIPRYDSPGAQSGGGGPNSELSEARVRGSNQPKKNTDERREQKRKPGTRGTRCGSAAEAMNQPNGEAGDPDGQWDLKRGPVAKRVIQPETDPMKTAVDSLKVMAKVKRAAAKTRRRVGGVGWSW